MEGAAPYDDGEDRREKKKKKSKDKDKDKKKHRTPEEKEARRARKAAKAAASADLDGIISDANLDDDANEAGTPGRVTESTNSPAAGVKSPAAKPKAAWGDVEKDRDPFGADPNRRRPTEGTSSPGGPRRRRTRGP